MKCVTLSFCAEEGTYVFPRLTLLGFDRTDPAVAALTQAGVRLGDSDPRYEGLEVGATLFCTGLRYSSLL